MNNTASSLQTSQIDISTAVADACARIAPAWPLDQAIAVNPWWQMRNLPMAEVAAKLETLGQVHCLMPKEYYENLWQKQISSDHLAAAAKALNVDADVHSLLDYLERDSGNLHHWHNYSDLLDAQPAHEKKMPWHDEIVQQISQFCGLCFEYPGRVDSSIVNGSGLYQAWLEVVRQDRGIEVLMGEEGLNKYFKELPDSPAQLFEQVYQGFGTPANFTEYAYALLLDIHGWASWMAYTAWQDAFKEKDNNLVEQLLAMRMAWEWVLWQHTEQTHPATFALLQSQFKRQFEQFDFMQSRYAAQQEYLWVWQRALEISYQQPLSKQLLEQELQPVSKPELQAAFCIDVRSEPMRRALEVQSDSIQTIGFAGFFGLPIEYSAAESEYVRPQLPGLLSAAMTAQQVEPTSSAKETSKDVYRINSDQKSIEAAPSTFGLVEMLGLFKSYKLIKDSFKPSLPAHGINDIDTAGEWQLLQDGKPVVSAELVGLAKGILGAMGLTSNFAPRVLLLGHGSCTANNPQAAALDCGACGGQTGEVNVKVLTQILNDPEVREGLKAEGIEIPEDTRFIGGLHNTTTDEIICYGADSNEAWQKWTQAATQIAQAQRAGSVGINISSDLDKAFKHRATDWSQIRPEWALANNAAFIVAPRGLTKDLNLDGRTFLHDYRWQDDDGFGVLELIMTAPMIVTNWINLQYYASTTDNLKYGSGNKMLHNVVADHIGVFEGNAGDLRIGLAMQSLHDGKEWRHQPVRLSVYIDAPTAAMSDIINRHEHVADLLNKDWLYLFQVDSEGDAIRQYVKGEWLPVSREGFLA